MSLGVHAALLLAGVLPLITPDSFDALPFVVVLFVGLANVFYLPGRSLMRILLPGTLVNRWESIPFATAASLSLLTPLLVAVMELKWNAGLAAWILWSTSVLLFVVSEWLRARREGDGPPKEPWSVWTVAVVIGLALIAGLLYEVGGVGRLPDGPVLTGFNDEEALQLAMTRKLAENEEVGVTNVLHKPDVAGTYVYPTYHFAHALTSRFSRLDPVQVFVKFRPAAALVGLLALYSILIRVLPRRFWADAAMMVLIVAALSGNAGQIGNSPWAQLVPLTHWSDFGRGVEYPLLLLLVVRLTMANASWGLALLAFLFAATSLVIHVQEVLLLVFYLASAIIGCLVLRKKDWRLVARLAVMIAGIVSIGLIHQIRQREAVDHVVDQVSSTRLLHWRELTDLLEAPPSEVMEQEFLSYQLLYRSVFVLPFLLVPFLLTSRGWFLSTFVGAGLLMSLVVLRVPYLRLLLVTMTYSEMVFIPARFFYPWTYVLLGLVLAASLLLVDRGVGAITTGFKLEVGPPEKSWLSLSSTPRPQHRSLAVVVGGVAAFLLAWAILSLLSWCQYVAIERFDTFLLLTLLAASLVVARRWRGSRARGALLDREPRHPRAAPAWLAAMLIPLYLAPYEPSLLTLARETPAATRNVADWDAWYNASPLSTLIPPSLRQFMSEELPPGQLFLFRYDAGLAIPMLTNHYVAYVSYWLSSEVGFGEQWLRATGKHMAFPEDPYERFRARQQFSRELMKDRNPIFAPTEPPETTLALVHELGVDYLVAPSEDRVRLERMNELSEGVVETVFEQDGVTLFELHLDPEARDRE